MKHKKYNKNSSKLRYELKMKILKFKNNNKKNSFKLLLYAIRGALGVICKFMEAIGFIASAIAIILFIQDGNMSYFLREQSLSKSTSIKAWTNTLSNVRLYCNKEYIEDIFGSPLIFKTLSLDDNIYYEAIYINDYFTLACLYNQNLLTGYTVIGNDKDFKFKNYRAGFSLFDCTINEAEKICKQNGVQSIMAMGSNFSNRLDGNSYFYECNLQHSNGGSPSVLIGYGVTDIGYIENIKKINDDILMLSEPDYNGSYLNDKDNNKTNRVDYYLNTKDFSIREYPVNFFFVFEDNNLNMELIQQKLFNTSIILSRDEYANLQDDYIEYVNKYLE